MQLLINQLLIEADAWRLCASNGELPISGIMVSVLKW